MIRPWAQDSSRQPVLARTGAAPFPVNAPHLPGSTVGRHGSRLAGLAALILLLRPHQWTKNLFCFAGLIFCGKATDLSWFWNAAVAFCAFCCASSAIYVVNDIFDRNRDREHPVKRLRPIASGAVSVPVAAMLALACGALAVFYGGILGGRVLLLLLAYLALNAGYTWRFKNVVVLDVMIISMGFILRVFVGTEAVQAPASAWILLCTFFLALFFGFGKRRAELNAMQARAVCSRQVLNDYNVGMLNQFCNIAATLAIAAYALFTMSPNHDHTLIITCPPVIFGLFRYLYLVERYHEGEAPDAVVLKDRPIQVAVAVWLLLNVAVLYFGLQLNIQ